MHRVNWLNSYILPIDGTLIDSTTLGQGGRGSNGNERALHIPQSSRIGISPSDGLESYQGHLFGGGGGRSKGAFHSAEMQSAYFTAPADWQASEHF